MTLNEQKNFFGDNQELTSSCDNTLKPVPRGGLQCVPVPRDGLQCVYNWG